MRSLRQPSEQRLGGMSWGSQDGTYWEASSSTSLHSPQNRRNLSKPGVFPVCVCVQPTPSPCCAQTCGCHPVSCSSESFLYRLIPASWLGGLLSGLLLVQEGLFPPCWQVAFCALFSSRKNLRSGPGLWEARRGAFDVFSALWAHGPSCPCDSRGRPRAPPDHGAQC